MTRADQADSGQIIQTKANREKKTRPDFGSTRRTKANVGKKTGKQHLQKVYKRANIVRKQKLPKLQNNLKICILIYYIIIRDKNESRRTEIHAGVFHHKIAQLKIRRNEMFPVTKENYKYYELFSHRYKAINKFEDFSNLTIMKARGFNESTRF